MFTSNDKKESLDISFVSNVILHLKVELGRRRLTVDQLSKLSAGEILDLDLEAGEPLGLYVNEVLVGRVEVFLLNGKRKVRVIDIVPPSARRTN
jgi:flagellar motor switch protein FliN/FliY